MVRMLSCKSARRLLLAGSCLSLILATGRRASKGSISGSVNVRFAFICLSFSVSRFSYTLAIFLTSRGTNSSSLDRTVSVSILEGSFKRNYSDTTELWLDLIEISSF